MPRDESPLTCCERYDLTAPTVPSTTAPGQNRMPRYGTREYVAKALAVAGKPLIYFANGLTRSIDSFKSGSDGARLDPFWYAASAFAYCFVTSYA